MNHWGFITLLLLLLCMFENFHNKFEKTLSPPPKKKETILRNRYSLGNQQTVYL